jgi:hypothetical protein
MWVHECRATAAAATAKPATDHPELIGASVQAIGQSSETNRQEWALRKLLPWPIARPASTDVLADVVMKRVGMQWDWSESTTGGDTTGGDTKREHGRRVARNQNGLRYRCKVDSAMDGAPHSAP